MRRMLLLFGFVFFIAFQAFGGPFEDAVLFDLDLAALSIPQVAEATAKDGRIVILEGLMGDSVVEQFGDSGSETRVWVNLVGGAWIGTDEVRSYSCRIAFVGERWLEAFPERRPKEPGGTYVPPGSRLLVAARVTGFDISSGASLAEMVDFRILD